MYLKHYNLKEKPFDINPNPRYSLSSEKHFKAFARLKYGITANKGLLLLTGDSGMGKTGLINRLIREFESETIIAAIPDPGTKIIDFFRALSVGFKLNTKFNNKSEVIIELRNFLHKSANKKVLLIIYETQKLSFDLLEQIRILSNIELPYRKLINIFFVGQTEFLDILRDKRSMAVRQRIAIKCHLEPLNRKETELYIRKRVEIAGGEHEIFSINAIQEIFSFSKGYPRLINIICDNALLYGYACRLKVIGAEVIKECSKKWSSNLGSEKDRSDNKESEGKREPLAAETKLEDFETPNIDSEENRIEVEEFKDKHESSISWEKLENAEAPIIDAKQNRSDIKESEEKRELLAAETKLENIETPNIDSDKNRLDVENFGDKHESSISWEKLENAEAPIIDVEKNRSRGKLIAILSFISLSLITVGYFLFGFNPNDERSWSKQELAFQKLPKISISETEVSADNQEEPNGGGEAQLIKESPESKGKILQSEKIDATFAEAEVQTDNQEELSGASEAKIIKESTMRYEILAHTNEVKPSLRAEKQKESLNEIQNGKSYIKQIKIIYFKPNSNELPIDAIDELNEVAKTVSNYPDSEIKIEGYTDSFGDYSFNEQLSFFRANVVKTYLIAKGIPATRIKTFGMGPKNPIASNETLEGRKKNRRVEISIIMK